MCTVLSDPAPNCERFANRVCRKRRAIVKASHQQLRSRQPPSTVACASEGKAGETPALTRNRKPTGRAGTPEGATYPELPSRLRLRVCAAVGLRSSVDVPPVPARTQEHAHHPSAGQSRRCSNRCDFLHRSRRLIFCFGCSSLGLGSSLAGGRIERRGWRAVLRTVSPLSASGRLGS